MVSTWQKVMSPALARMDVATQRELPQKYETIQSPGCRKYQSLSVVMDGSRHNSCVRCDQADDLLSWVSDLQEEVGRIRKSEKEMDWQNHSLTSWTWKQEQKTSERREDQGDPVFFPQQAEDSSLKGRSEWRQVHTQHSRQTYSLPTSPSQVPLYNRYKALDMECQSTGTDCYHNSALLVILHWLGHA